MENMAPKPDDEALINHIHASIKKWQSEPKDQQEAYVNIPGEVEGLPAVLNNYQMRLTHQIVRNEYPGLHTVGMKHFIQITNPTDEQQASQKLVKTQEREKKIADAVGFRWLMEAIFGGNITGMPDHYVGNGMPYDLKGQTPEEFMSQLQEKLRRKRRVIVGHNCFTDLVNLYKCFIGELPSSVTDFASEIHSLLPGVVDTKHLATAGTKGWRATSLEEVSTSLVSETLPRIDVPAEFDRYQYASSYHEAGYDSLLTAKIAIMLSAKMEREGQYLELEKLNTERNAPAQGVFGTDEDVYESAAESSQTTNGQKPAITTSLGETILSTVETTKKLFTKEETTPKDITTSSEPAISDPILEKQQPLLAVKERDRTAKRKDVKEVAKIKGAFGMANIYDSLELDKSGPELDSEGDSMSLDSKSSPSPSPAKKKDVTAMVKKGEIMPRWEGGNDFWKIFGNKLQVNGCQEGVCRVE